MTDFAQRTIDLARQNVADRVRASRARVTAATGPSQRRTSGAPNGSRPDHRPRAASGRSRSATPAGQLDFAWRSSMRRSMAGI